MARKLDIQEMTQQRAPEVPVFLMHPRLGAEEAGN